MSVWRISVYVVSLMFIVSWMVSTSAFGDSPKRAARPAVSIDRPDKLDKSKSMIRVLGSSIEDQVEGLLATWKNPSPDELKGIVVPIRVDDSLEEVDTANFFLKCLTKDKCPMALYPMIGMKAPGEKLWMFNSIRVTNGEISITEHAEMLTRDRK